MQRVLRTRLSWLRSWARLGLLRREWRIESARTGRRDDAPAQVERLLVVPSDPHTVVGARGDQAMIDSVIARLRAASPRLKVGVLVAPRALGKALDWRGLTPIDVWHDRFDVKTLADGISSFTPDAGIVVGADVLDGHYGPLHAARMLVAADLLARRSGHVSVLGFSFNSRPHPGLRPFFEGLDARVGLHVRDPRSSSRFRAFTAAPSTEVADAAFMLGPSTRDTQVIEWAARRRRAGDRVIGFNMHPLLAGASGGSLLERLVDAAGDALASVAQSRNVSWLLVPHDYRGHLADDRCLLPLAERLQPLLGDRIRHVDGERSASELKSIAGEMDGVITGRMHLAIAALGMGVPIAALTYQDKFEGLLEHFALPDSLLLSPGAAARAPALESFLQRFLDGLPALQRRVLDHLPSVLERAERNLAPWAA